MGNAFDLHHLPGWDEAPVVRSVRLDAALLPQDAHGRDAFLQSYLPDRVVHAELDGVEMVLTVEPFPSADYYVDPLLSRGMDELALGVSVPQLPFVARRLGPALVSLSDAWTLYSWSEWLSRRSQPPESIVVLHVDDHDDLMAPRLRLDPPFIDLLTHEPVDLTRPDTIAAAIRSASIGMGSFIAPLLALGIPVCIRHLCGSAYARTRQGLHELHLEGRPDTLLSPGAERPHPFLLGSDDLSRHGSLPSRSLVGTYSVTDDLQEWIAELPVGAVLLHFDLDYFNNRFNCDSDWQDNAGRHDPTAELVLHRLREVCDALLASNVVRRIEDVNIGISPGFFPAELWSQALGVLAGFVRAWSGEGDSDADGDS